MKFGPQSKDEAAVFALEELRADIQYEILKRMKQLGLTQAAFAKKMGKSAAWVSQILDDDANLTLDTISKIYLALGIKCHVTGLPVEASYHDVLWDQIEVPDWAHLSSEIGRLEAAVANKLTEAAEHERAMHALRERCREVYQALGRNAMLRQGDPVETIFAFAKELISEREYVIGFNDGWDEGRAKLAEDRS